MRKISFFLFVVLFIGNVLAQKEHYNNQIQNNKNKPDREEWLRDLGFGIFVHWSVDSQLGVVISHSMVGASNDYVNRFISELPKTFNPNQYDGFKMAIQAKLSGAKYIVFTAKHHSGFCMWDTQTTDFKITNSLYAKDLLKEYVEGARKAGLAVGLYYSPEDFKFLYDNNITIQRGDLNLDKRTESEYNDLIRRQTHELFSNYGQIDVLFIDGEPNEACKEEAWKLQPNVVITRGAINTPEQTLPGIASNTLWESCITMGTQWQYKPTNDNLKPAGRLIEILIETRAKGGNLLLNIGPHPNGYIADPESRRLTEMGAWNFINHEAVENVRPWIITNEDHIWFTASKDLKSVYAIITGVSDWSRCERKDFTLGSIEATPTTKIKVLGQNDLVCEYQNDLDATSKFEQKEDGLHISIVRSQRIYNNNKWSNPIVVKLENVVPALDPPVVQTMVPEKLGSKTLLKGNLKSKSDDVSIKAGFEYRPYAGFSENLNSHIWNKSHPIEINEEGMFSLEINTIEGTIYEYRAILIHPKITIKGDVKQF